MLNLCLETLLWCLTLLIARSIPPDRLLGSTLVLLKVLDLIAVHVLDNIVGLPLLEAETKALVRVVLVVGLILVVLDLDEVRVNGVWVERERDEGVDGGSLWDELEGP